MDRLHIRGGRPLSGTVAISRSKNASLPILAASLLAEGETILQDLPQLRDVHTLKELLANLGANIATRGSETILQTSRLHTFFALYDIVKTMRASILVLGPLLARYGEGKVSLPGGCAIGTRPIDLHLAGLKKLGAEISLESGYVSARAKRLRGNRIALPFPSVGATENLMMAASLARGESAIDNAATEPEIDDLAQLINRMGGQVHRTGTSLRIQGVESLRGCTYRPIPDRIETATYLLAGLICRSSITVADCVPEHLGAILDALEDMGCPLTIAGHSIQTHPPQKLRPARITTGPYPAFPTDVQAQMMAFLASIPGTSQITETIFENRFMHVAELRRLGAQIQLQGNLASIRGVPQFSGAPVMCTDLRASAALVLAALWAKGQTEISRIYHLDRGHESMERKLSGLGANACRTSDVPGKEPCPATQASP